MQKQSQFVVLAIVLLTILPACAAAEPPTVEVTREIEVPQTVEVTREVTRIVEEVIKETVEVEVVVTATPTPPPPATATPERTMEDYQSELTEALVSDLEELRDVERVTSVQWQQGLLAIELQTEWASQNRQPAVSWTVVSLLANPLANTTEVVRTNLTGSEDLTLELTTYSTNMGYRYKSETDFGTLVRIDNRAISYEEWIQEANAGFR